VPALSVRDLTGALQVWIDVGAPDAARLHKASKASPRVAVYTHREPRHLLQALAGERIHRAADIELHAIDRSLIDGLVSQGVQQRTREIGVRLALGASTRRVVTQIVRESLRIILIGATIGWLIVYVLVIHIAPSGPRPPSVFLGVPLLLLGVATLACWVPARRATAVDPMVALREE
jgi:hypothetical protein